MKNQFRNKILLIHILFLIRIYVFLYTVVRFLLLDNLINSYPKSIM